MNVIIHSRRGFTLLEVVLAAMLAGAVVLVTLSVFFHINRTDAVLAARAQDSTELANLRLVVQRTMSNFVMSSEPRPRDATPRPDGTTPPAQPRENTPPPPARVILEYEQSANGLRLVTDGNGEWAAESVIPQRLEVVVADSPIPTGDDDVFAKAMRQARRGKTSDKWWVRGDVKKPGSESTSGSSKDNKDSKGETKSDYESGAEKPDESRDDRQPAPIDATEEDAVPVRAVRGAFMLRPQPLTPREARERAALGQVGPTGEPTPYACEVWWVPLAPKRSSDASATTAAPTDPIGEPYLVARNITYLKWSMFDDGQERQELQATWESQLPGYVKLAVETASGISARWTFEVDWGRGPEVPVVRGNDRGPARARPVQENEKPGSAPKGQVPSSPSSPAGFGKGGK